MNCIQLNNKTFHLQLTYALYIKDGLAQFKAYGLNGDVRGTITTTVELTPNVWHNLIVER